MAFSGLCFMLLNFQVCIYIKPPFYIYIYIGLFNMKSTNEKELSLIYCCSLAQNHEFNNFLKNTTDCAPSFISLFCFQVSHLELKFDLKSTMLACVSGTSYVSSAN